MTRFIFLLCLAFTAFHDTLRGRALAYNTVMTPNEVLDGKQALHGTEAIATKNYVVVRGADDQHFKTGTAVTDVPLGILLNEEMAADEVDVVKKNVALFGVYQGTLPGVAEAAIAVDALLTPGVGTFGRVKTLPTAAGKYWVIGHSRTTVANAGDPVSIVHCTPYLKQVAGLTDSTGGTASATLAAITVTTPADLAAVGTQLGIIRNAIASLAAAIQ